MSRHVDIEITGDTSTLKRRRIELDQIDHVRILPRYRHRARRAPAAPAQLDIAAHKHSDLKPAA